MPLRKGLLERDAVQRLVAVAAIFYIRLVFRTVRWERRGFEAAQRLVADGRPFIHCFWHGRLGLAMCARLPGARYAALVSPHRDGRLIAATLRRFGIRIVDGSSFRSGLTAFVRCLEALQGGEILGVTPDGPRGPRMRAAAGVIELARRSGAPILPLSWSTSRRRVLASWDRFVVPLPFGRGVMIVGEPLEVASTAGPESVEGDRRELERRLNSITAEADRLMGQSCIEPAPEIPFGLAQARANGPAAAGPPR